MVMIVFSVLLALSLESWTEHRQEKALVREALANIRVELDSNLKAIEAQRPRQQQLIAALQERLENPEGGSPPARELEPLYPPDLSSAAWSAAMSTQVMVHAGFRTVQTSARFYEAEKWLDRIENSWLRLLTDGRETDAESTRQRLGAMLYLARSYVEMEDALTSLFHEALEAILAP
jgi:hypothetical protein